MLQPLFVVLGFANTKNALQQSGAIVFSTFFYCCSLLHILSHDKEHDYQMNNSKLVDFKGLIKKKSKQLSLLQL